MSELERRVIKTKGGHLTAEDCEWIGVMPASCQGCNADNVPLYITDDSTALCADCAIDAWAQSCGDFGDDE